jgi:hypothetical protein
MSKTNRSHGMWVWTDVLGLFSVCVGSFAENLGLGAMIFSLNSEGNDNYLRDLAELILEMALSQEEQIRLKAIIQDTISMGENVPPRDKPHIDRKLKYCLYLLDAPDAAEIAGSILGWPKSS